MYSSDNRKSLVQSDNNENKERHPSLNDTDPLGESKESGSQESRAFGVGRDRQDDYFMSEQLFNAEISKIQEELDEDPNKFGSINRFIDSL